MSTYPPQVHARLRRWSVGLVLAVPVLLVGCDTETEMEEAETAGAVAESSSSENVEPHVTAASPVEAGRYLIVVGGCNDCHTDGWLQTGGDVPESEWLAGSSLGWRGDWGTTYPANLRLRVQEMTEDEWVNQLHTRHQSPPMPWMNVNQMHESDARALYRYIQSLGPTGEHVPAMVPPGEEPQTPYLDLTPKNLPAGAQG